MFDTTRKESFRNVARWVEDIRNNGKKDAVLVLIGNKIDSVSGLHRIHLPKLKPVDRNHISNITDLKKAKWKNLNRIRLGKKA